jgi:NADPH:quinone reductase
MKAIVQTALGESNVLQLQSVEKPVATGRDLLVKIHSFALNPVDYKKRRMEPAHPNFILGWDGSGVIESVGSDVKQFKVGDQVVFAGSILRNGTYAEYTLVDERIVALKPSRLSFEDAAAFPLVSLTAYETLVETMGTIQMKKQMQIKRY